MSRTSLVFSDSQMLVVCKDIDAKHEQLNAVTAALLFILHSVKTQSRSSSALHVSSQQALLWSASLHSQSQHAAFALLLVLWPDCIYFTFLSA